MLFNSLALLMKFPGILALFLLLRIGLLHFFLDLSFSDGINFPSHIIFHTLRRGVSRLRHFFLLDLIELLL